MGIRGVFIESGHWTGRPSKITSFWFLVSLIWMAGLWSFLYCVGATTLLSVWF